MKHTSGPWAIRDDDEDGVVSIVGGSGIVLARVRTATAEPGDENARLIAAAPDLLKALQDLIDMDVAYQRGPKVEQAVENARAAIARATGEASGDA
jgi:hypothetical protein